MSQNSNQQRSFADRSFRDKSGKVSVFQAPNLPLTMWAIARAVGLPASGVLERLSSGVAYGALFVWAWLELFQGVNYFRRLLGFVMLAVLLKNKL